MKSIFLILCVFCTIFCKAKPACDRLLTRQEFVDIIEDVPKKERYDFICDNYLKGYRLVYEDQIPLEKLNEKSKLSVKILIVITENLQKNPASIKYSLEHREVICFPHPIGCIDSNDPGLRP